MSRHSLIGRMGNLTSEPSAPVLQAKKSLFLTEDEQISLHQLYTSTVDNDSVVTVFNASDKDIFRSALLPYFRRHINTYDQFEDFVVSCTRSSSDKIIGTFWGMILEDTTAGTKEALLRLSQVILELSLPREQLDDIAKHEVATEMVNFFVTNFFVHGMDVNHATHASVTPLLLTALNNYLPHTHKALETYISRVCFRGMHSPSYKPFVAPALDFPSEVLPLSHLLPLALHSDALQGAWKRLYSTSTDGMSFNRIVYHSLGYDGPTCVLVKCADPAGTVLGMLSHDHWKESNRFYGKSMFFCNRQIFLTQYFKLTHYTGVQAPRRMHCSCWHQICVCIGARAVATGPTSGSTPSPSPTLVAWVLEALWRAFASLSPSHWRVAQLRTPVPRMKRAN